MKTTSTTEITIDIEINNSEERRKIASGLLELISMLDSREYPDTVNFLTKLVEALK